MSRTEHAMTSADTDDSLEELFDDDDFDAAMGDALDQADEDLDIDTGSIDAVPTDDVRSELDDVDDVDDLDDAPDDPAPVDGPEVAERLPDDEPDGAEGLADYEVDEPVGAGTVTDGEVGDGPTGESADAIRAQVDEAVDADIAGADDAGPEVDRACAVIVDDDRYELPAIVPATPNDDDIATAESRAPTTVPDHRPDEVGTPDDPDGESVSGDILEELRRADIDGPIVEQAPQDDTASARRRPRRSADYDPAPVPIPAQIPRVLGRKPRVRKVTRVVRHVDPWSVFKIALVANVVLYVIVLTAGVLLWNVAHATGTVDNVERFFESFGWATFEFDGGEIYRAAWISGMFVVIGLTGLAVLGATLFNLITDLVGGMRFTVLEEEVVETRVSPMRRFVVRRSEPDVPAVIRDESGAMIREAVVDDTGANERPSR